MKPSRTVYVGLAALKNLQSLTLKLPAKRVPQPTTLVPAIPTLRYLHVFDIDPLCYPDDISLLLASCTSLETLKMAWSPRMRAEKEPSVAMDTYFGRAAAANVRLPLKHLALKNLYTQSHSVYNDVFLLNDIESLTLLNCANPEDPGVVFMDSTWKINAPNWSVMKRVRKIRLGTVDPTVAESLNRLDGGLQEVYIVNNKQTPSHDISLLSPNGDPQTEAATKTPVQSATFSHSTTASVAGTYIAALTSHHGPSLRILLLSDHWVLSDSILDLLIRSCPNLEQIAAATEGSHFQCCKKFAKTLPKLWAFRALSPVQDMVMRQVALGIRNPQHADEFGREMVGREVWKPEYRNIKVFGLGIIAFEFGKVVRDDAANGEKMFRREVRLLGWDEARARCEIFGMDSMEI